MHIILQWDYECRYRYILRVTLYAAFHMIVQKCLDKGPLIFQHGMKYVCLFWHWRDMHTCIKRYSWEVCKGLFLNTNIPERGMAKGNMGVTYTVELNMYVQSACCKLTCCYNCYCLVSLFYWFMLLLFICLSFSFHSDWSGHLQAL